MKKMFVLLAGVAVMWQLAGAEPLKVRMTPSPNLLKNSNFDQLDANGQPTVWYFDNCSKSPDFKTVIIPHKDGNIVAINTAWTQFGYWLQYVPIQEGKTYYASCEYQSDAPTPMLWLQCKEYYDGGSPLGHYPPSKTRFYMFSYLRHGKDLSDVLVDFVDPELVCGISSYRWTMYSHEFTVPTGKGCKTYEVRMGIYGGDEGQARYRRVVFREATVKLDVEVSGRNRKELRIAGAAPAVVKLDPAKDKQSVQFTLPSTKTHYTAELIDVDGTKFTGKIVNE